MIRYRPRDCCVTQAPYTPAVYRRRVFMIYTVHYLMYRRRFASAAHWIWQPAHLQGSLPVLLRCMWIELVFSSSHVASSCCCQHGVLLMSSWLLSVQPQQQRCTACSVARQPSRTSCSSSRCAVGAEYGFPTAVDVAAVADGGGVGCKLPAACVVLLWWLQHRPCCA